MEQFKNPPVENGWMPRMGGLRTSTNNRMIIHKTKRHAAGRAIAPSPKPRRCRVATTPPPAQLFGPRRIINDRLDEFHNLSQEGKTL
jgi:hypothetical protein